MSCYRPGLCIRKNPFPNIVAPVSLAEWLVYIWDNPIFLLRVGKQFDKVSRPMGRLWNQQVSSSVNVSFGNCQRRSQFGWSFEIYFSNIWTGHFIKIGGIRWHVINDVFLVRFAMIFRKFISVFKDIFPVCVSILFDNKCVFCHCVHIFISPPTEIKPDI